MINKKLPRKIEDRIALLMRNEEELNRRFKEVMECCDKTKNSVKKHYQLHHPHEKRNCEKHSSSGDYNIKREPSIEINNDSNNINSEFNPRRRSSSLSSLKDLKPFKNNEKFLNILYKNQNDSNDYYNNSDFHPTPPFNNSSVTASSLKNNSLHGSNRNCITEHCFRRKHNKKHHEDRNGVHIVNSNNSRHYSKPLSNSVNYLGTLSSNNNNSSTASIGGSNGSVNSVMAPYSTAGTSFMWQQQTGDASFQGGGGYYHGVCTENCLHVKSCGAIHIYHCGSNVRDCRLFNEMDQRKLTGFNEFGSFPVSSTYSKIIEPSPLHYDDNNLVNSNFSEQNIIPPLSSSCDLQQVINNNSNNTPNVNYDILSSFGGRGSINNFVGPIEDTSAATTSAAVSLQSPLQVDEIYAPQVPGCLLPQPPNFNSVRNAISFGNIFVPSLTTITDSSSMMLLNIQQQQQPQQYHSCSSLCNAQNCSMSYRIGSEELGINSYVIAGGAGDVINGELVGENLEWLNEIPTSELEWLR